MTEKDDYLQQIEDKKIGSSLLRRLTAPTLKNSSLVDVINGFPVVRVPEDKVVAVHSACGDSEILDPERHTKSMVNNLVFQAKTIGVSPVAFLNVVDASEGSVSDMEIIGTALASSADYHELSILDGEDALLGPDRVKAVANVSGTMISLADKQKFNRGVFTQNDITFAVFDPKGKLVRGCADGTGTKPDFYARRAEVSGNPHMILNRANYDQAAMVLDDFAKLRGEAKVVSAVFEMNLQWYSFFDILRMAEGISKDLGLAYILQLEHTGKRLCGHRDGMFAFNISGAAVGTIDEECLRNPPKPSPGEYLVAISGVLNMRSNGARDKRKAMIKAFGNEWHKLDKAVEVEGEKYPVWNFLEYLTNPSIVLYPAFKELLDKGLASSVYHMSGGAYKDKLARPLAQHGLFAEVMNLFPPSFADIFFAQQLGNSLETCYKKWPMGNDGFVTTSDPDAVIDILKKTYGLNARIVGKVESAVDGRTGVALANVKGSDGKPVYFSGRD